MGGIRPVIASELVPGALAPVKWEIAFVGEYYSTNRTTFWRAIPPSSDYVALGCVAFTNPTSSSAPSRPPDSIASRFRAVHKRAITTASSLTPKYTAYKYQGVVYGIESRYISTGTNFPVTADCYKLDPKNSVQEFHWNMGLISSTDTESTGDEEASSV